MVGSDITRRAFLRLTAAGIAGAALAIEGTADMSPAAKLRVVTVTGEMPSDMLGVVLPHEHALVDFIGANKVSASRYDPEEVFRTVLPYLKQARKLGCGALVECTPEFLARDPALLKRLSDASGLAILTPTGLYGAADDRFLPRFAFTESAEELARRWIAEWESGISDTGIRPGFIKIGVDPNPSEVDLKLARAAAITHLATGLTIASHTGPGSAASAQMAVLKEAGVDPSAFIWVHANAEADSALHVSAARQGAWVEFDGLGPDSVEQHVRMVKTMDAAGLLGKVLVSHDAGWYSVGEEGGGTFRPFDTLFTEFIPALRKSGFGEEQIRRLTRTNPQQAFALRIRRLKTG